MQKEKKKINSFREKLLRFGKFLIPKEGERRPKEVKKLLREIEVGKIKDKELLKLDNRTRNELIKKIIEINREKLKQKPRGNKEANEKLMNSAIFGRISSFLTALTLGADIKTRDSSGRTFLHTVTSYDHKFPMLVFLFNTKEVFELIRELIYLKDKEGKTIFGKINESRFEIPSYLFHSGYNPLIGNTLITNTPTEEYVIKYENLISKIRSREDIEKTLEENPKFNRKVFELGLALYFAENCDERLKLIIK